MNSHARIALIATSIATACLTGQGLAGAQSIAAPTEQSVSCQEMHVCEVQGQGGLWYLVTFDDDGQPKTVDIENTTCEADAGNKDGVTSAADTNGTVVCRGIPKGTRG